MTVELKMNSGTQIFYVESYAELLKWYVPRIAARLSCIKAFLHGCDQSSALSLVDVHQVQMQIEAHFVSDILRGNDTTEMRVTLLRYIEDEMPPDDE